ncbi:MAG: hypothetical protein EAZ95_02785 [Bacteroidetes bacterium]|nr:MAG: hypothetical protein EAZ95_02785 [Bacteroidota bacterium]
MKVLKINYPKNISCHVVISNAVAINVEGEKSGFRHHPPRVAIYPQGNFSNISSGYSSVPYTINFKTFAEAETALENIIHFFVKSGGNYMEIDSL